MKSKLAVVLILCLMLSVTFGCSRRELPEIGNYESREEISQRPETGEENRETTGQTEETKAVTVPSTAVSQKTGTKEESVQTETSVASVEGSVKPTEHTHVYTETVVPPTCTEDGYTLHKCSCGASYTTDPVPALGHSFGEWTTVKEPTYDADGEEQRTCERCGATESRSIPHLEREPLDFSALCQYGINYAVNTYGYEYWPGMRDGYYPPSTCYMPDMDHAYAAIRECVQSLTETLEARGEPIVDYDEDGNPCGMPFDIEIVPDPDGFKDSYLVYTYY